MFVFWLIFRFILRNYIAQAAIEKAEKGDYTRVKELMKALEDPYNHTYSEIINPVCPSAADVENEKGIFNSLFMFV